MPEQRFEPEHMGRHLQSLYLDDFELTPEQFASAIRLPLDRIEAVLGGEAPIDADLALRLARLFGGSGHGWLYWQMGYELWHARERIAEELEAITPLDPDARLSVREEEPLDPEFVEELREQLADARDPRRWVIMSAFGDEDLPIWEMSVCRTFYDVESDCYATQIDDATAFKSPQVAEALAAHLGDDHTVVEVTVQDLAKPGEDDAVNRGLRDGLVRTGGHGMKVWDVIHYLRDQADMAAYLEAAAEDGDSQLIAVAVADVMRALIRQAGQDSEHPDGDSVRSVDERFNRGAEDILDEFDLTDACRPNRQDSNGRPQATPENG